jgi:SpoIIAA-like
VIERIDGAPPGVLAFKAVGEVGIEDYTNVLKPAFDAALAGGRKIRGVFMIGPEYTGHTPGAKLEDLGLGLGFLRKWERCAIVTDSSRVGDLMRRFGWMMGKRLRHFSVAELPDALRWAAGE